MRIMRVHLNGIQRLLAAVFVVLLVGAGIWSTAYAAPPSTTTTEQSYTTVVIFRNDDIQPYWRAAEMEAVDGVFVDENVPVSLGVIPVVGGLPLSHPDNEPLCRYLRGLKQDNDGIFEVALHGYTHERRTDFQGASEFGGSTGADQQRWVAEGTAILRQCTGTAPTTFIPPFDSYDTTTVEVLTTAGYTVVSGNQDHTEAYFGERELFVTDSLVHVPNDGDVVADWSTHQFHTDAELRSRFDAAYAENGLYVQMIHYFTFTDEAKVEQLRSLIQYMKAHDDVRFMTLGEFGREYQSGRLVQTADGWHHSEERQSESSSVLPFEHLVGVATARPQ
jgi:peptidoglycan/xylan/chitin deacetylase (PgdA/CDA1 family)